MNTLPVYPGIRFNDYFFSDPKSLAGWVTPRCAGVFVLLVNDPNWAPKPYHPLFFGEFGNNAREILTQQDQAQLANVTRPENLFIALLAMPFSTTAQRTAVCRQLIGAYNPTCQGNGGATSSSDLARKLEELEKRHEEQSTYMQLLLANAGKLLEPPATAERPRRHVGFLPPSADAASQAFISY